MTVETTIAMQEEENELILAESFVDNVYKDMNDIKHSFFRIGFRLWEANELGYYKALGYRNITELAEDKFGFKSSTTYELIGVYELARDERAPMQIADRFDKFSKSQLTEISKVKWWVNDFMRIVSPSDTVANIREAVKIWNRKHAESTPVKSIAELIEKYGNEEKPDSQSGQLPGQTVIEIPETQQENFSEYSENREELSEAEEPEDLETVAETPAAKNDDEIINACLKRRMGTIKKFEIYSFYNDRQPTKNLFLDFVKEKYGIKEYRSPAINYNCGPNIGVVIQRNNGSKIELPWAYVAGRISRLITLGEYLSVEEQAAYIEWKAKQDGLVVNVEPAAAPMQTELQQEENSGYSEKLNFKNDKARREWLDNFRDWGVWLEIPEVNKTFYRFNFANGCALIVEIGIEYYSYSIKGDKELEYKSYAIIDAQHAKYDSHGISYTLVIQWLSEHRDEI